MRSNFPFVVSVTLPFGAGPGQQRLFLGPASGFPPALVTYLRGNAWDPVGGLIAYGQGISAGVDDNYAYLVQGVAFPGEQPSGWIFGSFVTGTFQTQFITDGGEIFVSPFGEHVDLNVGVAGGAGSITIDTGGVLNVLPDIGIDVKSGGSIAIEPGGLIRVSGTILVGTGAIIDLLSGSDLFVESGAQIVTASNAVDAIQFQAGSNARYDSGAFATWDGTQGPQWVRSLANDQSTATVNNGAGFGNLIFDPGAHTYRDGLAFEAVVAGHWRASVAGTTCQVELTNGSGGLIAGPKQLDFPQVAGVGYYEEVPFRFIRTAGAGDQSTGLIIRGSASGGNVTFSPPAGSAGRELFVRCIGKSADWPNLPSV